MHIKPLIFTLSFALISFISNSQNTFVPDDNFEQALIDLGYDSGALDDFVPTANISGVLNLYVDGKNIADLTGIEDFSALSILNCSSNLLTNLDVSQNTNLTELYFHNNQITNIDVSIHPNLKILWCFSNQLSNLNVTQNPNLISLVCWDNNLTHLDTSNNPTLNVLVCEQNQISSLDVTNNLTLNRFQCGNNLLTNLDVSQNSNLSYLSCEQNQLSRLDVTNNSFLNTLYCFENQLSELNLTQNTSLNTLNCSYNTLCSLNINNGNNNNVILMDFKSNPDLNCVVVDNTNGDHTIWEPLSFTNYVNTVNDCSSFISVDSLNDFIGISYTLPIINNGNYFTQSGGNGTLLNTGDIISTSQTIYIYNETACNSNESNFNVLITDGDYYIPKYFTPNNDGSHDLWKVLDNKNSIKSIAIYNKYGKLLKHLPPNSNGWNGTFNGQLLNSSDYWYAITLNTGEVLKGHFTLKR